MLAECACPVPPVGADLDLHVDGCPRENGWHPAWELDGHQAFVGDVIETLRALPENHFRCCVTSPPYWKLRDYGTEPRVWGGLEACRHEFTAMRDRTRSTPGLGGSGLNESGQRSQAKHRFEMLSGLCLHCGAWRGELGQEPTMGLYLEHVVEVFREVRRVLARDGTLWLNMGDVYEAGTGSARRPTRSLPGYGKHGYWSSPTAGVRVTAGLKRKDLIGMPWRVAFALQDDGWWLRSDIVWAKPNPMPESIKDRPTRAHEYLFLLTKAKLYHFDWMAVQEPASENTHGRGTGVNPKERKMPSGWSQVEGGHDGLDGRYDYQGKNEAATAAEMPHGGHKLRSGFNERWAKQNPSFSAAVSRPVKTRNVRSVWEIATQPFPKAHFATYPERLVEPCVRAGTSERGRCPDCGKPWIRVVEKRHAGQLAGGGKHGDLATGTAAARVIGSVRAAREVGGAHDSPFPQPVTVGWRPSCACGLEPVPDVVLDPFVGSGTTMRVARRLGRHSVGVELNPEYLPLIVERVEGAFERKPSRRRRSVPGQLELLP